MIVMATTTFHLVPKVVQTLKMKLRVPHAYGETQTLAVPPSSSTQLFVVASLRRARVFFLSLSHLLISEELRMLHVLAPRSERNHKLDGSSAGSLSLPHSTHTPFSRTLYPYECFCRKQLTEVFA